MLCAVGRAGCALRLSRSFISSRMEIKPGRLGSMISMANNWTREFLNLYYNYYSERRIRKHGAEKAAALWLLKAGGTLRPFGWRATISNRWQLRTYLKSRTLETTEVCTLDSVVMADGLAYLADLPKLRVLKLHFSDYLDDDGLFCLSESPVLAKGLRELEVVGCRDIREAGLSSLVSLSALRRLHLYNLPAVGEREQVLLRLRAALPLAHVTFPPLKTIGFGYDLVEERQRL